MIANMNEKGRQTKLLTAFAILAMVVCVFAVAMPSDGVDADTVTDIQVFDEGSDIPVTKTLLEAIQSQEDGQTWVLSAGTYVVDANMTLSAEQTDVTGAYQSGWIFPIYVDNLTIKGVEGTVITTDNDSPNGAWASQNFITVFGNGVTIENLSIVGKQTANKDIEVLGTGFSIDNVVIGNSNRAVGGSLYFNGTVTDAQVTGVTIYNSWISTTSVTDGTTVALTDVTIDNSTIDESRSVSPYAPITSNAKVDAADVDIIVEDWTFPENYTVVEGVALETNGMVEFNGLTNNGTIVNNDVITFTGTNDVIGTVDNTNGKIVIDTEDGNPGVTDLKVVGGELDAPAGANLPILEGGVILIQDGVRYATYTFTTIQGVTVAVGIPEIVYSGTDYAGGYVNAVPLTYTVNSVTTTVDETGWNAFPGYNLLYEEYDNAKLNNREFGTCINAEDYWVHVGLNVNTDTAYGPIAVTFLAEVPILPKTLEDISIAGPNGNEDPIADQSWTGDDITLIYGDDYNLYQGNEVSGLVYEEDYTVGYRNNVDVGTATIYVIWIGNYATATEVNNTFQIVQGLKEFEVEANTDTFYQGEIPSVDQFSFTGVLDDDTPADMSNATITILNPEVLKTAGRVEITFQCEYGDRTKTASCMIDVIAISGISATEYADEYEIGDAFDPSGMVVTITYADGDQSQFRYNDGFNLDYTTTEGRHFTDAFTFDPEDKILDYEAGDNVIVELIYCDVAADLNVTVTGYLTTYMYINPETDVYEVYGTQYSSERQDMMSVFNMVYSAPEGKTFVKWEVEDYGVYYYPGDTYAIGEDDVMWASGTVTFYAIYDVVETEPVTATVDGKGYYASADDAEKAMYQIWNGSSLGTFADETMFVIFDVTGSESVYYIGELCDTSGNAIYTENLTFTSPNGQKAWYFSFADGEQVNVQNPAFELTDGVYTMKVYVATETGERADGAILTTYVAVSSEPAPVVPTVVDIIVSAKTQYVEGDAFEAEVYAVYSNGSYVKLGSDQYTVSQTDMVVGLTSVTVTYDGISKPVGVTVAPAEPVIETCYVTFVVGNSSYTVSVVKGETVAQPYDPAAPDGQHFVGWFVEDDPYNCETAVDYDLTIKAKFQDVAPVYSEDVVVGVYYDESTHGKVIVTLTAMDGKIIPEGTVTITGNYTYMVDVPGLGPMPKTESYSASLPVSAGSTYVVFDVDDTENDFSFISGIISLTATYTAGTMIDVSNNMTYVFVAATTEA